jgi:hypothetical protein
MDVAPSQATIRRISTLKPSDLADDVVAAVEALGGEAQRVEIIDRALAIGGWSSRSSPSSPGTRVRHASTTYGRSPTMR